MPPRFEPRSNNHPWQPVAILLFVVAMTICGLLWAGRVMALGTVGSGLLVIPLLILLSAPLFINAARRESRFDLGGLMAVGLLLRFIACFYRYDHPADGGVYSLSGEALARSFRHFDFGVDVGGSIPGTGGMKFVAGIVAMLTNSNSFAEFLVFTWLSFLGCYLIYRAFVTAMPDGDHHRYALFIFLWPSLVFWPSSIGKESWMLLSIGIASLGAARVLVRRPGGYFLLLVGLAAGTLVRPHVAVIEFVAFAVAFLLGRRSEGRTGTVTPAAVAKVAGLMLLLVVGSLLASRTERYLDSKDSGGSVDAALTTNGTKTAVGGSAFTAPNPKSPIGYPEAVVTILFRPFPIESHGVEQLATSIEGLLLFAIILASWRRLISIPGRLRKEPYVLLAVVYLVMFFFAFGTISNFGILARERTQAMPFIFVLLSVGMASVARGPGRSGPARTGTSKTGVP